MVARVVWWRGRADRWHWAPRGDCTDPIERVSDPEDVDVCPSPLAGHALGRREGNNAKNRQHAGNPEEPWRRDRTAVWFWLMRSLRELILASRRAECGGTGAGSASPSRSAHIR